MSFKRSLGLFIDVCDINCNCIDISIWLKHVEKTELNCTLKLAEAWILESSFDYLVVRSHIDWRGERNILYKGVETSPLQMCFKNLEGKSERENPKKTMFARGGLGLLQIVSELDIGRYASEDAGLRRGVDCEISHRLERGTKHSL